jgi:hypothetical protein
MASYITKTFGKIDVNYTSEQILRECIPMIVKFCEKPELLVSETPIEEYAPLCYLFEMMSGEIEGGGDTPEIKKAAIEKGLLVTSEVLVAMDKKALKPFNGKVLAAILKIYAIQQGRVDPAKVKEFMDKLETRVVSEKINSAKTTKTGKTINIKETTMPKTTETKVETETNNPEILAAAPAPKVETETVTNIETIVPAIKEELADKDAKPELKVEINPEITATQTPTQNPNPKETLMQKAKRVTRRIFISDEQIEKSRTTPVIGHLTTAVDYLGEKRGNLQAQAAVLKADPKSSTVSKAINAVYRAAVCTAQYIVKGVREIAYRVYQLGCLVVSGVKKAWAWVTGLFSKKADATTTSTTAVETK